MTGLLLRLLDVAHAQVNLRQGRNCATGVCVAAQIECDRERLLEQRHRLVGVAEQEVETAEVVRELADVDTVGKLGIRLPSPLRVVAREHPMALAVGDERGLEEGCADRPEILDAAGQLERALDVVARSHEVALPLPAPRAPGKDVGLERIARQPGPVGQSQRLVQQRERRLHAAELVAAGAEPEQDLRPLDVGERSRLADLACLVEQLER